MRRTAVRNKFNVNDNVAVLKRVPGYYYYVEGTGTITDILDNEKYDVEFANKEGETIALERKNETDLFRLKFNLHKELNNQHNSFVIPKQEDKVVIFGKVFISSGSYRDISFQTEYAQGNKKYTDTYHLSNFHSIYQKNNEVIELIDYKGSILWMPLNAAITIEFSSGKNFEVTLFYSILP